MADIIKDNELNEVSGGWQYANGSFVNYGNYIVYTVAPGDVLSGTVFFFSERLQRGGGYDMMKHPVSRGPAKSKPSRSTKEERGT